MDFFEKFFGVWMVVIGLLSVAWVVFLIWAGIQLVNHFT